MLMHPSSEWLFLLRIIFCFERAPQHAGQAVAQAAAEIITATAPLHVCPVHFCPVPSLLSCRAGELSAEELEQLMTIVANPQQYKIPNWFLNRCGGQQGYRLARCWEGSVRVLAALGSELLGEQLQGRSGASAGASSSGCRPSPSSQRQ